MGDWSYIFMSYLSVIFWFYVNRHELSACLAAAVLGAYVIVAIIYVGGFYHYVDPAFNDATARSKMEAFYYLTNLQTFLFYAMMMFNICTLSTLSKKKDNKLTQKAQEINTKETQEINTEEIQEINTKETQQIKAKKIKIKRKR